jgi:hypothetical protein
MVAPERVPMAASRGSHAGLGDLQSPSGRGRDAVHVVGCIGLSRSPRVLIPRDER